MSLGYPNQNGGRTTDAALFHALGNVFKGTWVSGFKVRQNSPLGMSVRVGGESSTPDDLLVRDGSGATFPVCNLSSQPVVATVATANSANPRIDSVVVYIDSAVAANHTAANNQNRTKVAVVSGTPATSPSAPSASRIKSVVGSNSPYVVLADIRVNRAVTSISGANITDRREAVRLNHAPVISDSAQLADDIVLPQSLSPIARGDYSTSEVDTGRKWIDGRPVHQKTIQGVVDMQSSSSVQIPHGITGLTDNRVFIGYEASLSLGATTGPAAEVFPRVEQQHQAGIQHLGKTHLVAAGSWPWGNSRYIITLWYVK